MERQSPMKLLIIPMLVAVFGQAGDDPAKLMKAMEDKIAQADSIQVNFDAEVKGTKGGDGTAKGSLTLAKGGKVRIEINMGIKDNTFKVVVVSDGTKAVTAVNGMTVKTEDTPKTLRPLVTALLTRTGFAGSLVANKQSLDSDKENPLDMVKLSDFKKLKTEKIGDRSAEVIGYKITLKDQTDPITGSVWLDSQTNLPLKRFLRAQIGGDNITVTETYSNFRINPKIEGNPFELPK